MLRQSTIAIAPAPDMRSQIGALWRSATEFRRYTPQSVTPLSVWRWLKQFPRELRWGLLGLLGDIVFVSEEQTSAFLTAGNREVLERLAFEGLGPRNIIYVALDTAGSSSGVMLNVLRDRENMETRGSKFIYSRDGDLMTRFSNQIGSGAVVYVDDVAGSGKQFRDNRDEVAQYIAGTFAEFFVAACICEEALRRLEDVGVVALPGLVHLKSERPLNDDCSSLDPNLKQKLVAICDSIDPAFSGLGWGRLATMRILARNAPDTTPSIFRGSPNQRPVKGVFPRWGDLPISGQLD
jgi:hypothetical protein